jgi:hypothetical protein
VIDPDWRKYPETILWFLTQPPVTIDLRSSLTDDDRVMLERAGLHGTFAVVTPCDPLGRDLASHENAELMNEFLLTLRESGEHFIRVDACSPDKVHCEPSVALMTDLDRALATARALNQMAFFWYDGAAFLIIGALAKSDPIALPRSA